MAAKNSLQTSEIPMKFLGGLAVVFARFFDGFSSGKVSHLPISHNGSPKLSPMLNDAFWKAVCFCGFPIMLILCTGRQTEVFDSIIAGIFIHVIYFHSIRQIPSIERHHNPRGNVTNSVDSHLFMNLPVRSGDSCPGWFDGIFIVPTRKCLLRLKMISWSLLPQNFPSLDGIGKNSTKLFRGRSGFEFPLWLKDVKNSFSHIQILPQL